MRAVRNTDTGVRVVDVEAPEDAAGVRVRVRAAGICGSDLEMIAFGPMPVTLGHEFAGVLDDGSAVAVEPMVPCGECDRCLAGASQQCVSVMQTMYGVALDGGMADLVSVDASCVVPLPAGLALSDASLVEPMAVGVHGCHRGGVVDGAKVAIVGAGTIGLCCAAAARSLGAVVDIVVRHDAQREAAERIGVSGDVGSGYDVVFEAAGTADSFEHATQLARRGGTVVLVATTWRPIPVSFFRAQMHELTIVPAFTYGHDHGTREFSTAAAILAARPEIPPALITHRFDLADATRAFAVAADRASGAIKVVLEP